MLKTSLAIDVLEKCKRLHTIINNRKVAAEAEQELKDFFKANYPNGVQAGGYIVTMKSCSRTNLDKKQLELELGDLSKYETETVYVQVDVRQAK